MTPDRRQLTGLLAAAGLAAAAPFSLARAQVVTSDPAQPEVEGHDPSKVATSRDSSLRMVAPVTINGQGPFLFLVDTGSNRSCISRKLAEKLNLPAGPPVSVHTVVKAQMRPTVIIDRLQLGSRSQRRVKIPALDLVGGDDADGVLGVDWLKGQRLVLNFKGHELEIMAPVTETSHGSQIVVPARRRSGQLTLIDADVGGARISAMIDSGSELSLGNNALRKLVTTSGSVHADRFQRVYITTVIGETFPGDLLYVPFMRLGGLNIGNVPVVFAETHVFQLWDLQKTPAIILGMDLLTQFNAVALDFGRSTVRFDIA
ncbi:retroviral-like aspartic protease family protein [Phenylobacterium aquaticum]|uniref:retroviral-like aspartic protease family protein n=1 Tax=Phenylobacterium aquaticum TaxID=1763816 RepID=UPI0026EEA5C8|nr:retroviral-like aspartic protease family protein [Phenylobacterium aquaticum]